MIGTIYGWCVCEGIYNKATEILCPKIQQLLKLSLYRHSIRSCHELARDIECRIKENVNVLYHIGLQLMRKQTYNYSKACFFPIRCVNVDFQIAEELLGMISM